MKRGRSSAMASDTAQTRCFQLLCCAKNAVIAITWCRGASSKVRIECSCAMHHALAIRSHEPLAFLLPCRLATVALPPRGAANFYDLPLVSAGRTRVPLAVMADRRPSKAMSGSRGRNAQRNATSNPNAHSPQSNQRDARPQRSATGAAAKHAPRQAPISEIASLADTEGAHDGAVVTPSLMLVADRRIAQAVVNGGRMRATLLELWQRTRMDWGFVTDRLTATFRREHWIGKNERRFLSEAIYGMIRNVRRIDAALARVGRKTAPRDFDRILAYLVLEKLISADNARSVEPALAWQELAGIDEVIAQERKLDKRIALAASLPDWLAARLCADWGDEAEVLAHGLNHRAPMTVRSNLLRGDRAALIARLQAEGLAAHAGRWCETAVIVDSRTNLFATQAFTDGAMEAQDEASQLLADLAVPRTAANAMVAGNVLDLCAGAGGKSLAIAARMNNRGRIIATDVDGKKLEELRRRARRAGVSTLSASLLEQDELPDNVASHRGKFDVVMVDAPCSGIGALRRNPEARFRLQPTDLTAFAVKQRAILQRALGMVAPGGHVVYATCTLLREENEAVVDHVLSHAPTVQPVALTQWAPTMDASFQRGAAFTSRPHIHDTDGFFAQVLRAAK